eukprot:gene20868-22920_t
MAAESTSCGDQNEIIEETLIMDAISFAGLKLGYDSLREHQIEGATSILRGKDTFVAKPNGSGKSLIFFLVPFAVDFLRGRTRRIEAKPGFHFVVVISPLVSLMKDQIQILSNKNVRAINLEDPSKTPKTLKRNDYSFLFCSPESILRKFRSVFRSKEFQKNWCVFSWTKVTASSNGELPVKNSKVSETVMQISHN